ncbi:hypothetical protein BJY00DRAFT_317741 [Aspergillus carlsbadensis]|nr:hypothetical protein BJY00DRAFT_317741 [Aspergillus carlsbadensis]
MAYRQGDNHIKETYLEHVDYFVADTLALIKTISDPVNYAPLEAERTLAEDCEQPSIPDLLRRDTTTKTLPIANPPKVVGGLTAFLLETISGIQNCTWEKQVAEVERDIHTQQGSMKMGKCCNDIRVMAKSTAQTLLNQLL